MEEKICSFDLEKVKKEGTKIVTRDGRNVRLICYDRNHYLFKIVGLIQTEKGIEEIQTFTRQGYAFIDGESKDDLFVEYLIAKH